MLADLSLILFVTTATALSDESSQAKMAVESAHTTTRSDPVAVWRADSSVSLADWLFERPADPREILTISVGYGDDADFGSDPREQAMASALDAARDAADVGYTARIVLEPESGDGEALTASFAFDRGMDSGSLAQSLLISDGIKTSSGE